MSPTNKRYYHINGMTILEKAVHDYMVVMNVSVDFPEVDHLVTTEGLTLYHMVDGRMLRRNADDPICEPLDTMTIPDYIQAYPRRNGYANGIDDKNYCPEHAERDRKRKNQSVVQDQDYDDMPPLVQDQDQDYDDMPPLVPMVV